MRRGIALTAAVVVALLGLAGCTKPDPGVSVWAGTKSLHEPAACWSTDAATPINQTACAAALTAMDKAGTIPTLKVIPGSTLGISVDRSVTKQGWVARLGSNTLTPTTMTTTYWRFAYPQLAGLAKKNQLVVLALGSSASSYRGVWVFNTVESQ